MPSNNPGSARMSFQWKYVDEYYETHERPSDTPPLVLNLGCADDPLGFGTLACHVDIDDWTGQHKWFKQADAAHLPFPDEMFELVILGDMLEHVEDPPQVVLEACRVTKKGGRLVFTIFQEWRLPGPGQWIKEGQILGDEASRALGFTDREDYQVKNYPKRKGFDDNKVSHLIHINQFTDEDIKFLCAVVKLQGFTEIETLYAYEVTHEGHDIYNWLLSFERSSE